MPEKIREGTVLLAETLPEREDVRNAAQSILIEPMQSRLRNTFERPALDASKEFYEAFFWNYTPKIVERELQIWEELGQEVDRALAEKPDRELTAEQTAYLTIAMLGHEQGPSSMELYVYLPLFARTYEQLLHWKYGDWYTTALFYKNLRRHMPELLLRFIALDSALLGLVARNLAKKGTTWEGWLASPETRFDWRFFDLADDESMAIAPKFMEEICKLARKANYKEDHDGRTEDRGCPLLYSSSSRTIIDFAIEELIAQHQLRFTI